MPVIAIPAEDADFDRIFEITSLAFARNEPVWDVMYPAHWTPAGRAKGSARMLKLHQTIPETTFIKAVDTETGEILGMSKWNIFQNYTPKRSEVPSDVYETEEDRRYAQGIVDCFIKDRNQAIIERNGNVVSLDILTVDPAHHRKKVGDVMVKWGTQKADELGFDAIVESSVPGRGLYEKNGFVWQKDVVVQAEGWAEDDKERPAGAYAWLVREKRK
ncbi:Putative GNAT domain, acyl-CoA N-acyltransferase [Septoria linicola]|uniref:GNAT domain, acyl-CoA N-acyltransferase n=1 Tax=Septoria linicola TaxID=215465 RepID=A0A9Q9AIY6_9PEZI|nr:putative GNAT domain, acyl-CoA N-acyltransferase [Septoria linicola]USW48699.1 Putative GNAT domain, acyl-CoA N-acyltransferase [Septoria linicola]